MAVKLSKEQARLRILREVFGEDLKNKKTAYGLTDAEINDTVIEDTQEDIGEEDNSFAGKLRRAKQKKEQREDKVVKKGRRS